MKNEKNINALNKKDDFLKRTQITENCWNWIGNIDYKGYGIMSLSKHKKIRAHRFSYLLHKGIIVPGMLICHNCDNRKCVNPNHLYQGTAKENTKDMLNKSRGSIPPIHKGEKHHFAKLKEKDILRIRELNNHGISQNLLSKWYNVAQTTVHRICLKKSWKSVL